jgi:ribosomal protein S18 acetylase RimI-like enzyme
MISLRPITPDLALIFKDVRLRALKDMPQAFSSTYATESQLTDDEWRTRSQQWNGEKAILYIAVDHSHANTACGIVACYGEDDSGSRHGHVISMWVDPAYRRAGVGRMLVDGLKAWGYKRGLHALKLMVTSVNLSAIDFYLRVGFRMTGKTGPYPNDPAITEYEMLLGLDP